MNFNAKDDFVTEQEIREEQEQLAEDKRADEEDNGYDHASLTKHTTTLLNGVPATEKEEQEMKQYASLLSLSAREAYKHLYNMGLKTEQIREKLDYLARFLGEFGTSRLSAEQWGHINMWLKELESLQVKL
jgi:exonuclease III